MHLLAAFLLAALVASPGLAGAQLGSWSAPQPIAELNTPYGEGWAHIADDGLTLYYSRYRVEGAGGHYWAQLYQATRASSADAFASGTRIPELAFEGHVHSAWVSPDNLHLYFLRTEGGSEWVIRRSTRPTTAAPWGASSKLVEFNGFEDVANPELSADELTIVFDAYTNETTGALYTASRADRNAAFTNIQALTALNTSDARATDLSGDGLTLYFIRQDGTEWHNYVSMRPNRESSFVDATRITTWDDRYHIDDISADGQTAYLGYGGDLFVSRAGIVPEPTTFIQWTLGLMLLAVAVRGAGRGRVIARSCRG